MNVSEAASPEEQSEDASTPKGQQLFGHRCVFIQPSHGGLKLSFIFDPDVFQALPPSLRGESFPWEEGGALEGGSVRVFPVLFTQGVNLQQKFAEKMGSSASLRVQVC